ncbi:MAG TPA: hypothetical protein VML57_18215, partial [Burkholderiales bacterium]|nr:hypothetical protein [Burkholderiales bacterium]
MAPANPVYIRPIVGFWRWSPLKEVLVSAANSLALEAVGIRDDLVAPSPSDEGECRGGIVATIEVPYNLPPRAFVFAYDCTWETFDGFVEAVRKALIPSSAHLHGVIVLSKGWYLHQVAHQPAGVPKLKAF